jgi:hypothetical protein
MNPFLEGGIETFNYGSTTFVVDYYPKSDSWQCTDAQFIVKGRGKTRMDAICEAQNQWNEYSNRKSK